MDQLYSELMQIIVPAVTTVVGLLVAWGLAELRKYIKTKTTNEASIQAFDTVSDLIQSTVASINQTTRKAFADGKLTENEKKALKESAAAIILNQIPAATKSVLERSVNDITEYINHRIEQTVAAEKRQAVALQQ